MAFENYDEASEVEKMGTPKERYEKYAGWIEELSNTNVWKPNQELEVHSVQTVLVKGERFEERRAMGADVEPEDYDNETKVHVEFIKVVDFIEKLKSDKTGMYYRWKPEGRSW